MDEIEEKKSIKKKKKTWINRVNSLNLQSKL
jgi:hypothetical protein